HRSFHKTILVTVAGLYAWVVFCDGATTSRNRYLPSETQAIKFIADTVDWYRHLPSASQIGTESTGLLFLEDSDPIAKDIVRLSFEFGKAMAAVGPAVESQSLKDATGSHSAGSELQDLFVAQSKLQAAAQEAMQQKRSLDQARLVAPLSDRKRLDAEIS